MSLAEGVPALNAMRWPSGDQDGWDVGGRSPGQPPDLRAVGTHQEDRVASLAVGDEREKPSWAGL